MATENTVSFKVFLTKEDSPDQPEVRRFGIDRDVVSNFSYLREKLQLIFPSLNGKNFTVHWKDSDGDNIIITSDEELMIALTEMQTDVRKLYVVKLSSEQHQHKPQDTPAHPLHVGVTCDGCGKAVQGFRYKCVQCPDFDLCSICEAENLHGEHFMIRVPVPINWRPHFGRRLAHHLSKSARKGGATSEYCYEENQEGSSCPAAGSFCPYPPRGHHGRHRGRGGNHHGLGGHNWLETLSNYLSEWTNLPGEAEAPNVNATTGSAQPQQEQQHVKFLKTVGQTVAQLLDPLGIDVDVEVRTKSGTDENVMSGETDQSKKEKSRPADKNVRFADNVHETSVKEVANKVNGMTIDDKTETNGGVIPKAPASNINLPSSPESEGWTVVNEMEMEQVATTSSLVPPSTPVTPVPAGSGYFEAARHAAYQAAHQAAHDTAMLRSPEAVAARKVIAEATKSFEEAGHHAAHHAVHHAAHHAVGQHGSDMAKVEQQAKEHAQRAVMAALAAYGNNNIYPNLTHQAPRQDSLAPEQVSHHPQPHINTAVQQMMSMGFTNEGGWLTQLVETQSGDIAKVLDVLQPYKK